jgi:ABC-type multidrug transport system ATPase subunit
MSVTDEAPALATYGLSKQYGTRQAVKGLNLSVDRGLVYGFLGPNGAGKTTTIRMILGLIGPTAGRVEVAGVDVTRAPSEVLPRIGALVEAPALYGYMSGRDNLRAFGSVLGGVGRARIDEVLTLVGLDARGGDRVGSYSLGMKQRLGLAAALLHQPELIVLDEPTNGLDPAGVIEMRSLLRAFADEGRTAFISSHVLAEVQQICDRVAIINHGELVREAAIADLLSAHGEFVVRVQNPSSLLALLREQPWGSDARLDGDDVITISPSGQGRELAKFLGEHDFWADSVWPRQQNLEEIFLQLTEKQS